MLAIQIKSIIIHNIIHSNNNSIDRIPTIFKDKHHSNNNNNNATIQMLNNIILIIIKIVYSQRIERRQQEQLLHIPVRIARTDLQDTIIIQFKDKLIVNNINSSNNTIIKIILDNHRAHRPVNMVKWDTEIKDLTLL